MAKAKISLVSQRSIAALAIFSLACATAQAHSLIDAGVKPYFVFVCSHDFSQGRTLRPAAINHHPN
jgi:hypothetical protein